jgi:hypothetical protein
MSRNLQNRGFITDIDWAENPDAPDLRGIVATRTIGDMQLNGGGKP